MSKVFSTSSDTPIDVSLRGFRSKKKRSRRLNPVDYAGICIRNARPEDLLIYELEGRAQGSWFDKLTGDRTFYPRRLLL